MVKQSINDGLKFSKTPRQWDWISIVESESALSNIIQNKHLLKNKHYFRLTGTRMFFFLNGYYVTQGQFLYTHLSVNTWGFLAAVIYCVGHHSVGTLCISNNNISCSHSQVGKAEENCVKHSVAATIISLFCRWLIRSTAGNVTCPTNIFSPREHRKGCVNTI